MHCFNCLTVLPSDKPVSEDWLRIGEVSSWFQSHLESTVNWVFMPVISVCSVNPTRQEYKRYHNFFFFEPKLNQASLNTGQFHTQNSQVIEPNYLRQVLINAKLTKLHTYHLCPVRVKHTSWHTSCLHNSSLSVIKHTSCAVGETKLVYRSENTGLVFLYEQPSAFQEVICPWASGGLWIRGIFVT